MLELKRERMSVFIGNARCEIEALWNDLLFGETERDECVASSGLWGDEEHTEDLLARHEEEIARLKDERSSKAVVLKMVGRWSDICKEELELQVMLSRKSCSQKLNYCPKASASDQSRLTGRGPRDPGRLLREEKMRKRVMKEKPKVRLRFLCDTWTPIDSCSLNKSC